MGVSGRETPRLAATGQSFEAVVEERGSSTVAVTAGETVR
jgi:hypothetical protein